MNIDIKLGPKGSLPNYAHPGDAGLDLVAASISTSSEGYSEYDTQVHIAIPEGYVGLIFPRSSISKKRMTLTNSVGVIDSSYRGSIKFRFKPALSGNGIYGVGDRIGQLIIIPYPQIELNKVEELPNSERGENGYGSTGN